MKLRDFDPTKNLYERVYADRLADLIIRTIEEAERPPCAHYPLQRMLDRFSSSALYPVFPAEIRNWLKYLLAHPQTIYYYWSRNRL
jgi:hypothetical protein